MVNQPESQWSASTQSNMPGRRLEGFLFDGAIVISPIVAEKVRERVVIFGRSGAHQIEWASLLTGPRRVEGEQDPEIITEFFELPSYNADKEHHLTINMDDVEKIDREYPVKAFLHSHPNGNVVPTLQDWMTFLYMDFRVLKRPILYIVMAPDGSRVIFSFKRCHESKDCPLSLLKNIAAATRPRR